LYIEAHGGYNGGFRFGDKAIDSVSVTDADGKPINSTGTPRNEGGAFGDIIKGGMCKECVIVILGCDAYSNVLIANLAKQSGCKVIAGRGTTTVNPWSRTKWGFTTTGLDITNGAGFLQTDPSGNTLNLRSVIIAP
jgi:hypothetical protein